ncbi:unnamed protein product, partial [marine sediment metagenome]
GFDWQNAVNVPLMVEGEQTITPRLFVALFPNDAPMDVKVEGDAPEEQGIRIKGIIQHHFRVADVPGECYPAMTQCSLLGTGYVEGGQWFIRKGWQIDNKEERYFVPIEKRPDAKFVNWFELYPHPAKMRMNDTLPIIRKRYIDAETLKKLAVDSQWDAKKLKEALDSECPAYTESKYKGTRQKEYEILEYWGPWDESFEDDNGEEKKRIAVPYWIIVVNRSVRLRGIPNPYNHQMPPYCKIKLFEDPQPCWFGVGIGQVGKPTQDRINKIVNQRLDNVDLVLNKQ